MLSPEKIRELVKDCSCGDLVIGLYYDGSDYLQVSSGKWSGRKWRVSLNMTPAEVVQTALAAVLAWYEHEAREAFKYRGLAIFNPHIALDELVARAEKIEVRG